MRKSVSFLFLFILGCASSHPVSTANSTIVATFAAQKVLRHFRDASALAVDQFGNAYVVETSLNSVIKISPNGDSLHDVSGFGDDHYQFNGPSSVDARLSNAIFIADRFNHRIEQYTKDLVYSGTLYTRENSDPKTRFGYPAAVAADDAGNIYVADGENKRVIEFRSDYSYLRTIGGYSEAMRPDAILSNPVGLAVDNLEHLIVLDNGGTSLVEYDNLGNFIARTELKETAQSISTWNGEVYALISGKQLVQLFQSKLLQQDGYVEIIGVANSDASNLESFVMRYKQGCLLSRTSMFNCMPMLQDSILIVN